MSAISATGDPICGYCGQYYYGPHACLGTAFGVSSARFNAQMSTVAASTKDALPEDTLTRRWDRVLDDLTAYLARELTPDEEKALENLIASW